MSGRCVFCIANGHLEPDQILVRGTYSYVCAPRGQLVEGFLVIAPYRCIGAYSMAPAEHLDELCRLSAGISEFYARAYRTYDTTRYEQGRGGGTAVLDRAGGFPLHAHLCHLPVAVDLHGVLAAVFDAFDLSDPGELPAVAGDEPYLFVDGAGRAAAYMAHSAEGRETLESARLRRTVAEVIGLPERADWRACPADHEVASVVRKWRRIWPT